MAKEASINLEIRFHGRGGQGVVTASKLLAEAALGEGKHIQALPEYGAERMGAPIRAFARISSLPIIPHCLITEPDIVVVIDATLLNSSVIEGLKKNGMVIVNSLLSPNEIRARLKFNKGKVVTVDATGIAMATLKRNIPNLPILGALLKASRIVTKENMIDLIKHKFATMKTGIIEANLQALERGYNECQIG